MPSTCVRRRSLSWANLLLAKRPKRPQPSVSLCIEQKASMDPDEPPRRQRVCCTSLEVDDKAGFGRGTGRAPGRLGMLRANMKKSAWLWLFISGEISFAQVSAKIDFRRDVQPLFREHCIGCHGPTQQMNGFRLDQRRYVMPNRLGANGAAVAPWNRAKSRLSLNLAGNQNGPQMPPAGPLPAEQIEIVKAWIDQGAEWPDDLSGEAPVSPADPKAIRLMEALRSGDRHAFRKVLR